MIFKGIVSYTPKKAQEILDEHERRLLNGSFTQRPVNRRAVEDFAAEMRCGRWHEAPDAIRFDPAGNLLDGQHRLYAVVKSGYTLKAPTFVVPTETLLTTDTGSRRTAAQNLKICGESKTVLMTSTLRAVAKLCCYELESWPTLPNPRFFEIKKQIDPSLRAILAYPFPQFFAKGGIIGPIVIYHASYPRKAAEFVKSIIDGELSRNTGAWLLNSWLVSRMSARRRQDLFEHCKVSSRALQLHHLGEKMTQLHTNLLGIKWLVGLKPGVTEYIHDVATGLR